MTLDFGAVLYIENALLTAGVVLALFLRQGHHVGRFSDDRDFMPPAMIAAAAGLFWPVTWACAAIYGVARAALALARQKAA